MKIAVVTEDKVTISQHFGRAPLYIVLTVENGKITGKEIRQKTGHHDFTVQAGIENNCVCECEVHGYKPGAADKHTAMSQNILDCSLLITRGMGWGAYESVRNSGIEPIITDIENIDDGVEMYLKGRLPNQVNRLH